MMVATLRSLSSETLAEASESLTAYVARGEARPAFQRALAAQLGDFVADPV
jgi:glutathione S-transferase